MIIKQQELDFLLQNRKQLGLGLAFIENSLKRKKLFVTRKQVDLISVDTNLHFNRVLFLLLDCLDPESFDTKLKTKIKQDYARHKTQYA